MKRRKIAIVVLLALALSVKEVPGFAYAESVRIQENMPMGKLNFGQKSVHTGEKFKLKLTGAHATEWVSNHPEVATVSNTGEVVAKRDGYANIVAKVSEDEVYVCKLVVKAPELSKKQSFMYKGATQTIKLYGAKVKSWKSSKTSVATVSKSGKVTAKAKGTAILTCTDTNGKTYSCKITVDNKGNSSEYTVEQIKKKLGKYEINKIYVKGEKAFCYYATNGAFGNDIPSTVDLIYELRKKYPNCSTTGDLKCIMQSCDPMSAMSACSYSIYYMEEKVSSHSDYESVYRTIRTDEGDSIYNYLSSDYQGDGFEKEPIVQINATNFPSLYRYLYPYDLNGDGWLSSGELYFITDIEIQEPVADLTGIEKLNNLWSLSLRNYTGTKIRIPKGTKIENVRICPNTNKLVVDMPEVKSLALSTYYGDASEDHTVSKMDSVNLSKCNALEELQINLGNCDAKVILPSSAPNLKRLSADSITNTTLDLYKYSNLESFGIIYSHHITSIDLSKNKKLKDAYVSRCKKMSKSKVKLPKGKKIEFRYWDF